MERFGPNDDTGNYFCYTSEYEGRKCSGVVLYDIDKETAYSIYDVVDLENDFISNCVLSEDSVIFDVENGKEKTRFRYDIEHQALEEAEDEEEVYDKYTYFGPPTFELDDGRKVGIDKESEDNELYFIDDSNRRSEISELSELNLKHAAVFANSFYLSDGRVYGITTSVNGDKYKKGHLVDLRNIENDDIQGEVLFSFNIETQDAEVLCNKKGGASRIIGYDEGEVYIFENNKVYKNELSTQKRSYSMSLRLRKKMI